MKIFLKKIFNLFLWLLSIMLFYSGLTNWFIKRKFRNKIVIIFYHEIADNQDVLGSIALPPKKFKEQIQYLLGIFTPISEKDLNDYYHNGTSLPEYSMLITFDGGYKGNIDNAYPILKKYNVPALIYVVTNAIEENEIPWNTRINYLLKQCTNYTKLTKFLINGEPLLSAQDLNSKPLNAVKAKMYPIGHEKREQIISELAEFLQVDMQKTENLFMDWDDLKLLQHDDLISIGSHTVTHPRLNEVNYDTAFREIFDSKLILERKLETNIDSFCYPDGKISSQYVKIIRDAGYKHATLTENGANEVDTNPYLLKRYGGTAIPPHSLGFKLLNIRQQFINKSLAT